MKHDLATALVTTLLAQRSAWEKDNKEWESNFADRLAKLRTNYLPSGSGFDGGTCMPEEKCNETRLVFQTSFHHMDEHGGYTGWTDHTVTVRPIFGGLDIKVSGKNKNDIKEYIREVFHNALTQEVEY